MNPFVQDTLTKNQLIQWIEDSQLTQNQDLIEKLKGLNLTPALFREYFTHDHDPLLSYGRHVIHQGKNYILYLMSWAPGDFTAIHSHGSSDWGAVVFLSPMNHRLYEVSGKTVRLAEKGIIPAATVVPVKGSLVHAMGNLSAEPAVTLHLYGSNQPVSNANDDSRVYELEKRQIRTTGGAAYLDIREELCKHTEPGLLTDPETLADYLEIIRPYYLKTGKTEMIKLLDSWLEFPGSYFSDQDPE